MMIAKIQVLHPTGIKHMLSPEDCPFMFELRSQNVALRLEVAMSLRPILAGCVDEIDFAGSYSWCR